MNFLDYVIKKTDKYTKMGLNNPETKEYLLTLQVLNYRACCMKESYNKDLEIMTELDSDYFGKTFIDPNKESGK